MNELQEPVLRWLATTVFAGCAIGFCTTLGDVAASSSFGLLFGALFAGIPAALLWARELSEATVRRERAALRGQGSGRLQLRDEDDDEDEAPSSSRLRSVDYDDD